jgi:pimeloyl-ACP methyl ester carboxylesterase
VVLLPGWAVSAYTYRHQLPALAAVGYRAIAVDLKGHGFADKPCGRGEYTLPAMLRHAREVVEAVARGPTVLIAQSMAAPLAVELARERDTIAELVLISPVGLGVIPFIGLARLLTPRLLDPIAPYLAPRWLVRFALGRVFGNSARLTEDIVEEYWAPAQFPGFARTLRALVHDFAWSPVPDTRLAPLVRRTLVVLGSRDRVLRGAPDHAARVFGPNVVVVPDGGHAVNEEYPEPVNDAIVRFLGRPARGEVGLTAADR